MNLIGRQKYTSEAWISLAASTFVCPFTDIPLIETISSPIQINH
jgi:hypothetical protein